MHHHIQVPLSLTLESIGKFGINSMPLEQGWAIVLARGPLCGSGGWQRAAPSKIIAFIS
jgi:hypothetical protein